MSDFRRYGRRGWLCGAALLAAVSWGGGAVAADQAAAAKAPDGIDAPSYGAWGFDMDGGGLLIAPGQNFFGGANCPAVPEIVSPPPPTAPWPLHMLPLLSPPRGPDNP